MSIRAGGYDFAPSEFSLHIRYKPSRQDASKDDVPGFYLTAGFANEGVAHWYADEILLPPGRFEDLLAAVAREIDVQELAEVGSHLSDAGVAAAKVRLTAAESQLATLQARIPQLREAVFNANGGEDPEA